ncbi:acyl-CoA dehydrogenase family protein [Nocardia sp. NPDC127526]|uniref:acyl-CoA dehydrogenase family protein n=1 Tax=Nocardia sp. NPDC127526 TaxID=3345393 RepID=UPI003633330F
MDLSIFQLPEATMPEETGNLRAEVRAFLDKERVAGTVLGRPAAWLSSRDTEFSRRLAAHGWIGMWLPEEYGGKNDGWLKRYVVLEELVVAGAPVAAHWLADRQSGPNILAHGTDEQRRRYLPAIAEGRCFFSIGMSEKEAGSDLASVRTRAQRTETGWRITGTKMWTGSAHVNDYAIVLARTNADVEDRHQGLSQFIVDLRAPGVRTEPIHFLTGEHRFNAFHLEGVEGGPDMLLGGEGDGWKQVTAELAYERSGPERVLATTPVLIALLRELTDRSVSAEQQARIGRLVARLVALRHMSLGVATILAAGGSTEIQAALVKDLGTRFQGELVDEVRNVLPVAPRADATPGSYAEVLGYAIRYLPSYTLGGGANEILRSVVIKGMEKARKAGGATERSPWNTVLADHDAAATETLDPRTVVTTVWQALNKHQPLPGPDVVPTVAAAIARDAGYHGTPGPISETLLVARPILAAAGFEIPQGPVAVAHADLDVRYTHPDPDSSAGPFGAEGLDSTLTVNGSIPAVAWGRAVDQILVLSTGPHGPIALLLDRDQCRIQKVRDLAGEPRDTLVLVDVEIPGRQARPITQEIVAQAESRAAIARAALIAGAAERCVELTVDYTATRHQFGQPLSRFQAVRQEEALLIGEVAVVSSAVDCAVNALGRDRDLQFISACAKAQASASVAEITRIAHQLHGAIGFTELSQLHHATTRLWSWREDDGSEHRWARIVGQRALIAGADNFWRLITATTD